MGTNVSLSWRSGKLGAKGAPGADASIEVADSWLVADGRVRALELHRARFFAGVGPALRATLDLDGFWEAAIAALPSTGQWFPRVELRSLDDAPQLALRIRPAPTLTASLVVATYRGPDPRRCPSVKGPDLSAMASLRADAQRLGGDESVITSPEGYIVEGTSTAILWWRGTTLCAPLPEFDRIDSITAKSVITVASAMGTTVRYEAVRPRGLDGLEVWAVNALHGIRIITAWVAGPRLAAEPHRLDIWRARLDALSQPLVPSSA